MIEYVLNVGYVKLVTAYGSDEEIIEDARQSTNKGFLGWDSTVCPNCEGRGCRDCNGVGVTKGDASLLQYLYENKHFSPFEGSGAKFEIKAPIFVFREWHRHRTQSYNELSARYTVLPNENYLPSTERLIASALLARASKNRQVGAVVDNPEIIFDEPWAEKMQLEIRNQQRAAEEHYQFLLNQGVPKELARLDIPVSRYSKMRATANLRNWFAFLTLRDDDKAQWEIRQFAKAVSKMLAIKFPRSHELYLKGRNNGN